MYLGQDDDEEEEESSSPSLSSSDEEEEEEDTQPTQKRRKRESEIQKKVRKFWHKRGLVKYGREWQTYSASYIKECVRQVQAFKHKSFSTTIRFLVSAVLRIVWGIRRMNTSPSTFI